ncbi:uncharacterized protein EHS24_008579 [Apiotrichum porosum]|uniref:Uncharacterized protein n=1 Tax=Apiotrichum porosum TaxID=105984 RepID=A0A427XQQ2_9TREE|nr:uncharacterized protein EHS24_008579 [Apiotrichum porosum]RSH81145.1 hypothetical protein EHS24_008579 [Apiotrichum porosum]
MPPTLAQVQALYGATRTAALRFQSYNFHAYFIRRTNERFAPALAALGDTTTIPAATLDAAASGTKLDAVGLDAFVADASEQLHTLERSGLTNAMYAGNRKLVVEVLEQHRHLG